MIRVAGLVVVLALACCASAGAAVLAPVDQAELANDLADASAEQGVCYGWRVTLNDSGTVSEEAGSNFGPGVDVASRSCPDGYALLDVAITYTCGSCEAEDSATFTVDSDVLRGADPVGLLRELGYDEGDLLGDRDDDAIVSMAGALPLLVAEERGTAFVPFETSTLPVAQRGMPTDSPGSDLWRENGWTIGLGLVLLLGGLAWWLAARLRTPPARRRRTTNEETT